MTTGTKAVLNLAQVLGLIGGSSTWAYRAINDGTFPLRHISIGRKIVFVRSTVRELLGVDDDELRRLLGEPESASWSGRRSPAGWSVS